MISKEKIIDLVVNGKFTYGQIAKEYNISRNIIAGIIWRHKNPGQWTKKIKSDTSSRKRHLLKYAPTS